MRAVVQRASRAQVSVDGAVVGQLSEPGLVVLLGITHTDTAAEIEWLSRKIATLRILRDEVSAQEAGASILLISQFTLYADIRKGRRPSWNAAAPGPVAEPMVEQFGQALRDLGLHVETGVFGADMAVELVNDGPVTILLDSDAR